MSGVNTVSRGASSAIDPAQESAAKIKRFRDLTRNQQREWTRNKLRLMENQEQTNSPNEEQMFTARPIKMMEDHVTADNYSFAQNSLYLPVKHHRLLISGIPTKQLSNENRCFGFDPVDLVSGAYIHQQTDFHFPSTAPIEWAWSWDSLNNFSGSLGNRIHFCFDSHFIVLQEQEAILYTDFEGRQFKLPYLNQGAA